MSPARRWIAVACALVAAAALALAVQGSPWWTIGDEVGIGTVASRNCFGDTCQESGLGWTSGSATWVRSGAATYAGGLVAALVLVALAGALTARARGRLAALSASVAVVTVAAVGVVFYVTRPTIAGMALARGPVLLLAGLALAVVAITLTLRQPR